MAEEKKEELFTSIGNAAQNVSTAEDREGNGVQEVESLCMECGKNGTTKLLLTVIPYFREVVLMSFECPHCGFKNAQVQHAETIQPEGSKITFHVEDKEDLNRTVVKSQEAIVSIPEIQLEIPGRLGQLTTIEGILSNVVDDLSKEQESRKESAPQLYDQINAFIEKVNSLRSGSVPFTITVDDITGNSWIEMKPGRDGDRWSQVSYKRTLEQNTKLGLVDTDQPEDVKTQTNNASNTLKHDATAVEVDPNEVHTFHATCPSCSHQCDTHMKLLDIPHFKEVIIMSTVCDRCGYRSNEVKTGGEIPPKGRKITLKVMDAEDLSRDILKSETASLKIPELGLDLFPGTLGGRFTTIEGLLAQVYDELYGRVFSQETDSMTPEQVANWQQFLCNLTAAREGATQFTLILDDPLSQSYLQNYYAPDPDPNMTIEEYERSFQVNEELGLNDMKTENYEKDGGKK
ncbi:Zinc finger protein zpr1 [Schizosaccharomyces pombe]|uniref:Zinc finger chaperone zpr1 n=1 Tax=Schizosaccharomyces pombe (strain 972 / ATCC 24843) TaxID=284812 RepID=ZPR1_SCHPO|nr:putative EF-1 alpha-binding zinc finger protein Zpr1 [Schizosaccharomyces pombe]O13724.1 RecName: Full=Zinc finger chaperone zpr1 [Schizosaccharomyces pombe 972h-]CAB10101.1 EF-1 alpha binding zinc finger protein Zpr1 (predicted) [Schizosaccharomyces pombe]|eukprot:NP_594291.1 putative EF-1 alpha-binding zinc finger protein Zpr1 [Schizosaccharomyces pombe]